MALNLNTWKQVKNEGEKTKARDEYKFRVKETSVNSSTHTATYYVQFYGTDTSRYGTYEHYMNAIKLKVNGTTVATLLNEQIHMGSGRESGYTPKFSSSNPYTTNSYTLGPLNEGDIVTIALDSSVNSPDTFRYTSEAINVNSSIYAPTQYTITYKPGSYATGSTYTDSADIGSKITLRGATYTRTNYTQKGWSTAAAGTTKNYSLSTAYSLSDGTVLYPYWESNYVTVSYNANGGTGTINSQSVLKGNNVTLSANGFTAPPASSPVHAIYLKDENGNNSVNGTATCYENKFYRWGLNSATGTSYQPGVSYGPVNSNTTFYAKWSTNYQLGSSSKASTESQGYQVIFNAYANGGNCSTPVLNSKIYTHYDFAGWLNSDKTKTYAVGAKVGGAAAYTYYESWTSRTENGSIKLPAATKTNPSSTSTTIYLNANGGTCNTTSMKSSATLTYNFDGWYDENTRVGGTNDNFIPNQATTLIARFTTITSSFDKITLPTPTRTGYKFLGWSIDENATSGTIGQYIPSGGETLYAIWKPNGTVRISIDGNMTKKAQAYIFHDGAWHLAQPQTNYNNNWKINGG